MSEQRLSDRLWRLEYDVLAEEAVKLEARCEDLAARAEKAEAALRQILVMIEDANRPYERLAIGAIARAALAVPGETP